MATTAIAVLSVAAAGAAVGGLVAALFGCLCALLAVCLHGASWVSFASVGGFAAAGAAAGFITGAFARLFGGHGSAVAGPGVPPRPTDYRFARRVVVRVCVVPGGMADPSLN